MIFKTINSSVDETRKTLALFNKDWDTYKRNWQNANGIFGKIGSVFTPANAITKSDIDAIKAYNSQIDSCVTSQTAFNRTMLNASPAAQNLVASYNGGKVSAQGMTTAQNAAKTSTIGLTIAQTALNAAIGMGIGLLISLVVKGIDKLVHANEEAIEKAEKLRRKYEEFKSTNESNVTTLNGLKKEFEELSKGVSQYGDNISLTAEQYARYKEIVQQIVGISPSLAEGYSTENGYIADKNGLLERAIELQEQEYHNELRKKTNLDNLKTSMSGYIAKYKEAFDGGLVTDDMSATATRKFTDLKNAIYDVFNTNNRNDFSSEDMIKQIISTIGIEDIESEMAKYYNEYGYFQDEDFWNEYADIISENIEVITNSLSADDVGLDDTVFDQNIEKVDSAAQSYLDMKDAISMANESIQRDLGYIAEYADGYSDLSTEQQKFVNEFLKGYNISDIMSKSNNPFDQGWKFDEDKMASVKSQITKFVETLSQDETTKEALTDLYAIPTDEQSITEFVEQFRKALEIIKSYCEENGIEIPIAISNSEQSINDLEAQYQRAVDFAKDKFDGYDPTAFFNEHSINTQEEIDVWQEIAQGARDAAEAEKEYLRQEREQDSSPSISLSDTVDQLNTRLKPALDSLKSAWNDIFTDNGDGFPLNSIDLLSTCDSIKSKLDELNETEGITVDYSAYEDFIDVLNNSDSEIDDVKESFNDLARSITQAALSGTEDFATLKASLGDLGIVNNELVAFDALISNTDALKEAGLDLAIATDEDIAAFADEMVSIENLDQAIDMLTFAKLASNTANMDTSTEVANLKVLAENAGYTGDVIKYLTELEQIYQGITSGTIPSADIPGKLERAKELTSLIQESTENIKYEPKIDFSSAKKAAGKAAKETQKEIDIMAELNAEMDKLQSAYKSLCDIKDTYNKYGKITVDQYQELTNMGFNFLANLVDENGELGVNANAFEQLAQAKLEEMQIQMARNAIDTINGLRSEAEATEYLTYANENLRDAALSSTEALLYQAQAMAHLRGEQQGLAADQIVQGYEASKQLAGKVEFGFDPSGAEKSLLDAYNEEKKLLDHLKAMDEINNSEYYERLLKLAERYFGGKDEYRDNLWEVQEQYHEYLESIKKTYNWIENLLSALAKKTNALIDKVSKFVSWQKKNAMINRAIKASDREITQNQNAYQIYMSKANSAGLSNTYIRKIQEGSLTIEELSNEELSEKIEKYQEWYDKAQEVLDSVHDLYDSQRDLIRQKLDNVLDYYSDMDSYLSSVTSKIESLISLNDEMGKRNSLTELLQQFTSLSDQMKSVKTQKSGSITITEGSLGDSKKVAEALKNDRQQAVDTIKAEIDNLDAAKSGTYTKLLNKIAKTQAQIEKYEDKGWDVKKAKQYAKLQAKLQDYYDLQKELDQYATSNTIANYNKIYTAYQKLQNKLDSGKTLSKSEQRKYDSYAAQIDALREQGASALDKLYDELAQADGSAGKQTEADKVQEKLDNIKSGLENSATYQNLLKNIQATEDKLAALDEKGYDNLTKKQKKTYDKLQTQLEAYYAKKESLDENATASNIAEYNKLYDAWKKLQDKLDKGGNLSASQWKKYDQYTKQLQSYADEKADTISKLEDELNAALNPGDKLQQIQRTYEESAKDLYDSYNKQIDGINNDVTSTKQYQDLLAKAQKLEQKKDTKGLTVKEQATLDKYNAELEALRNGGMSANISDYMKTWEAWYKLQQKLDNGKNLSASEAKNYDTYKAKLEAWNKEKQSQINDLLDLMENDLQQLQKTYTENISETESEINDYYANLYSLAKQIAEYNISSLQTQLTYLESCIAYYKELVSLYDSFSGDKLTKLLKDLGETDADNEIMSRLDLYAGYLDRSNEKYDTILAEINEYTQLLDSLDENDFEASMELFSKAMETYKAEGNDAMAKKLQSVLDLLNERAIDADNWGDYADEWANEWSEAISSAKQELISTAKEIQEINDALREISFENITDAINELEKASAILSSIESLIQDDWLFEPDGNLSEYGRAKAALLVSQLEDAQAKANAYLNLYDEIQKKQDTYASDKAYKEDLNNALQSYYDSLNSAASLENSIMDLMKKNAEAEINSLKDIIDARKKALQAKKEYYDYDKSIRNSQKEIDSLKAQIAALESLSDATDAATKAKLAQLKAELAEKEDALQETKDDHTYNLQIDALDEFTDSLTDALDNSSKSVEEILKEQTEIISSAKELYQVSSDSVNETLDKLTAFYSGMGMVIDGTDLKTNGTGDSGSNGSPVISLNPNNSNSAHVQQTTDAIGKTTNAVEMVAEAINRNGTEIQSVLEGEHLVRVSDAQMLRVFDNNTLNFLMEHMPPIAHDVNHVLTNSLKQLEIQQQQPQPNITIHYDNMINVEGNVDRRFLNDFKDNADELYKNFTERLSKDLQRNGVNIPRRTTLPTVK